MPPGPGGIMIPAGAPGTGAPPPYYGGISAPGDLATAGIQPVSLPSYTPPALGMGPPPGASPSMPSTAMPGGPGPPQSLTNGIPDPGAIARQKDVYIKMLDEQLKQGVTVLDQQVKYQKDYLTVQCEQQKKQFLLQLDQQVKAQEMALTQQYNEQLMALRMQADSQKAALEQQAMQLTMEYEQRKAEEHMYRQQYEIQKQQSEMATKMHQDQHQRPPSPMPGGPQGAMYGMPMATQQNGYSSPMPGTRTTLTHMLPAGTAPPTVYGGPPCATQYPAAPGTMYR